MHALTSAAYLINQVPFSTIDFRTPSQALNEAIVAPVGPNLPPHVFGCVVFVHLHKRQRNKLTPRALRCVFLGYMLLIKRGTDAITLQANECLLQWM